MSSPQSTEQIHIHIAGSDRPGILAEALATIVRHECLVVDIKQFVFNGLLNLSVLLESKNPKALKDLQQALKAYGTKAGMQVAAYPWDREHRPEAPYKHRLVVTLLGQKIGPVALQELTRTLADLDINIIRIEQRSLREWRAVRSGPEFSTAVVCICRSRIMHRRDSLRFT